MNFKSLSAVIDMALGRSEFVSRVESLLFPIVTHLCCLKAPHLKSLEAHWAHEIHGFCSQIMGSFIKGANTENLRTRAINQAIDNLDVYLSRTKVFWCQAKFKKEHIENPQKVIETINDSVNDLLKELITILASQDLDALNNWVDSLVQ